MKLNTKYPLPVKLDRGDLEELDALLRKLLSDSGREVRISYSSAHTVKPIRADDLYDFTRSDKLKDSIFELRIEATDGRRDIVITYDSKGGTVEALDSEQDVAWEEDVGKELVDFLNRRKHPYIFFMLFLIAVVVSSGLIVWVTEQFAPNPKVYRAASIINVMFSLALLTAVLLHRKGRVFPFADINLGKGGTRTYSEKVATASFIVSLLSLILIFVNSLLKG